MLAGVSRVLASWLEQVANGLNAAVYCAGIAIVLSAAVVAAYFSSRKAARIDPMAALRTE